MKLAQFLVILLLISAGGAGAQNNDMLSIFSAAQDTIDPLESASNKVKLSSRQAMLSETIAKSICFVYLGHEPDENLRRAAKASALFSESLDALRTGSVQKAVRKEENPELLAILSELEQNWRQMKNVVDVILTTRTPLREELLTLDTANRAVLEQSRVLAAQMQQAYGGSSLGEDVARTISVASNQRALVQEATKQFCFAIADINRADNETRLKKTRADFFSSIFWLFFGDETAGILPPTNYELDIHYEELFGVWFLLERIFDAELAAQTHDAAQLAMVQDITAFIAERSEQALTMY